MQRRAVMVPQMLGELLPDEVHAIHIRLGQGRWDGDTRVGLAGTCCAGAGRGC